MRIHRTESMNPLTRWRWEAAGVFGYSATKRGAAKAARAAIAWDRRTESRRPQLSRPKDDA